ncbi:MAG: ATP-dependent RecD-like DNA helicase [Lachnospiraceae bacterium]|nr:ATP-dependent RecD-like DNA helicase [Lachnospiraceae bacterium]
MTVELNGCVDSIVYRNEENGYTVFELATKGDTELCTCVGSFSYISEGEYLKLECSETNHPAYGKQYKIITAEVVEPEDAVAMERYLGSGAIKGVGKALAARIVKYFGDDTFRVIEEEPERLADIKGISEKMARSIGSLFYEKREMRNAMMFLQKYGVSSNLAVKIYKQYGMGLYEVLRKNPYRLAEEVSGVGFKTADDIAIRGGGSIDSEFRNRAGLLYVLSEAVGQGHTYLPEERLIYDATQLLGVEAVELTAPLDKLLIERKIIYDRHDEELRVYLAAFYYMELGVARMLLDLNTPYSVSKMELDEDIAEVEESLSVQLDELQREAIAGAVTNGVFVLTGGPGTGKTTTINAIIRYFENKGCDILLAAPTGRAAKRISETSGREASTIHRMLQLKVSEGFDDQPGSKDMASKKVNFEKNEDNPLEADVIIIDEMSMVDISLMNSLLKAVSQDTRLIMVGDANQLPPVGAGNVLRDVIASKRFKTVCLTRIFRQAAQSNIVVNAHKINDGQQIDLDVKNKDFFLMERDNPNDVAMVTVALIRDYLPKNLHINSSDIQILTPMRKGELGVERLNNVLQQFLNPPSPDKKEKEYRDYIFREGDKVMQNKNNYQLEWETRNKKGFLIASGTGIFNGDCGIIKEINNYASEITIVFDEDKTVHYPFGCLDELELAYCMTVHKSQGSEYTAVIMPLLTGPIQLFNRNLLYTAVTRAKTCVSIVGSKAAVNRMINNTNEQKRYSSLAKQLTSME